jgi:hypothetical protein
MIAVYEDLLCQPVFIYVFVIILKKIICAICATGNLFGVSVSVKLFLKVSMSCYPWLYNNRYDNASTDLKLKLRLKTD